MEYIFVVLNICILAYVIRSLFHMSYWLCLIFSFIITWILFLNVNPYTLNQTKFTILSYIPSQYIPKMSMLKEVDTNDLQYPVIFKPVKCTKDGRGLAKIRNSQEALEYMEQNNIDEIMVQNFVPYSNEIGVLYEKKVISIMTKEAKKGKSSDIMNSCFGDVSCTDLTHLITPKLNEVFQQISRHIPNYNVGRFDVKYKDMDSLLEGKDFYILEANGTAGFDPRKNTFRYFGLLCAFYLERWFLYRQWLGLKNIVTLKGYNPIKLVQVMYTTLSNAITCWDWEKMLTVYS
jgi:hypothetical protein